MNSQFTSHRRLVFAALLVLSASAVFAQVNNLSVLGSFDGHGIGVVQGTTLQASGSGSGSASQIGRFTYVLNATVNLLTGSGGGVFLLVFSNGDVIHGSFSGQGGPMGHVIETLTINGGTGRFQGATGSLTFDRMIDQSTLPAFESHSGTVKGTISTPASTK